MIVVSNSSPIISLAAVGRLNLLEQLYGLILIPEGVHDEIVVRGSGLPGSAEVQASPWIQARPVKDRTLVAALQVGLDEGEAEAIALAVELAADIVLLDDHQARMAATRLGVSFVGLLGVLIEAKAKGLIPAVKPVLDDLMVRAGFWVAPRLYAHILQATGE